MKYKAYICSKDATYHVPDDFSGIFIYFSEDSIRENYSCVGDEEYHCKIVEIVVELPDNIEE